VWGEVERRPSPIEGGRGTTRFGAGLLSVFGLMVGLQEIERKSAKLAPVDEEKKKTRNFFFVWERKGPCQKGGGHNSLNSEDRKRTGDWNAFKDNGKNCGNWTSLDLLQRGNPAMFQW